MLKFSDKFEKKYGTVLLTLLLLIVLTILFFSCIKGCSRVGKQAKKDTYKFTEESGFINKTNDLLAYLLNECEIDSVVIKNVEDLNRRYPAFKFSLPLSDTLEIITSFVQTSDIRLVDIDPSKIKDPKHKEFYDNSSIPALLEKQKNDYTINFFKINFSKDYSRRDSISIKINSIKIIPSLFKLSLEKELWKGTLITDDCQLFPEDHFCFLSWTNNVLPIMQCTGAGECNLIADLSLQEFQYNQHTLDLIDLSMENYRTAPELVSITIRRNNSDVVGTINIRYLDDSTISIKTDNRLTCKPYLYGSNQPDIRPTSANGEYRNINFENDIKLTFSDGNVKIAEMILSHDNPLLLLSGLYKSNQGLARYTIDNKYTDKFTRQIIRGTSNMLTELNVIDTVKLTIDPILSKWLENEIRDYTLQLKNNFSGINSNDHWEMSATVIDMASGKILAIPFYRTDDELYPMEIALSRKNPALTKRYIGSTFKPLLTLAAVQTCPNLINMNTISTPMYGIVGDQNRMFGYNVRKWANTSHWNGRDSISTFLAASCDVFPVAMTILALNNGQRPNINNSTLFCLRNDELSFYSEEEGGFHWNNQPLIRNLDKLYKINSYSSDEQEENSKMTRYIWRHLFPGWDTLSESQTSAVDIISPDQTIMHYENFNTPPYKIRSVLTPWVLGQGSNDWSCLKLAEAWSRMLTKRDVNISMVVPNEEEQIPLINDINNNVWNSFLQHLRNAQTKNGYGLLRPMEDAVQDINRTFERHDDDVILLFSKTGTPDNYSRQEYLNINNTVMHYDLGLYCMGLMTNRSYNAITNGNLGSGIVCIIRISRISNNNNNNGISSTQARNFFSALSNRNRLEKFYWLTRHYYQ